MCGITFFRDIDPPDEYKIQHRGPDNSQTLKIGHNVFVFHRLAINDLSSDGDQPLSLNGPMGMSYLICNGEIYNWKQIKDECNIGDAYKSQSDCEIILHLYQLGLPVDDICRKLDGVFSFVLLEENGNIIAGRDPLGVRPLYWYRNHNKLAFASEYKALQFLGDDVHSFPVGSYYANSHVHTYDPISFFTDQVEPDSNNIRELLTNAIEKHLMSDRPVAFLLSGGLDSSLVASIASEISKHPIHTFSIGLNNESPDIKYARKVAEHIGSKHTEVYYTPEKGINALHHVIYHLESYDCTTVRASTPMYLLMKHISENTEFKVILSGEGADELFGGYIYFRNAPTAKDFQEETVKLLQNVNSFDVLRADRCTSAHGLELRVPFFDKALVNYVLSINPKYKTHINGPTKCIEKYMLRDAFDDRTTLPDDVLWRQKDAFSDAVGYSWIHELKKHAATLYDDPNAEELLYKEIYTKYYGDWDQLPYQWRPRWTTITDPSATYLDNHITRT